ncbi:2-isopropylmalate synthase [Hypnocyclicus thermotrophus]|uniref:2-isopropylmalate synthase n=1 Tax=Hypnocyclicus thermotrophus TaxID=1627895 RepID=A0AA46I4Y4_9FUSO|nr:2-isopropylmalate synthase [Hypnocyclicus thermotrophus]TDT68040.1 2-isopropylmalate synthase [Hypnocyclicus thermotrophus]
MKKIKIFDTTLRDGEQAAGVNLNLKEKILIAKQLEAMGVDIIEAGFPIASNGDFESVREIAKVIKKSTVAGLARARKEDIDRAYEALKYAKKPRIHTFIATSDIHMKYKLKMSKEEVLNQAYEMVKYAKSYFDDIEFSAEDAYRSDPDFLCEIYAKVIEAGATTLNIPDTVGYALPEDFGRFIKYIIDNTKGIENVDVSVHCHNDLGLAVANSLAAIRAGATQVECTVNGIGERAGNAAMEELVMTLKLKKDVLSVETNIDTTHIHRISTLVSSLTGMNIQANKAIVGANAFAHESGIHQDGVLKEKSTYEIISPEDIGLKKELNLVLGKHSGKHAFENSLKEMGIELESEELLEAFKKFKDLADKKKHVTTRDVEAIVNNKTYFKEVYKLKSFQLNSGNNMTCTGMIELIKGEEIIKEVAIGEGSIDALFKAIERVTNLKVELKDYSIKSVTGGKDALGEVTVRLAYENNNTTGKAIDEDIIQASINAYLNAINKMLDNIKN